MAIDSSMEPWQQGLLARRFSWPLGSLLCASLTLAFLLLDLFLQRVNLPILYIIPLLIYAQTTRRAGLIRLALLLVTLTYARYFLHWWPATHAHDPVLSYRLLNRTFAAFAILTNALILRRWIRFRAGWENAGSAAGPLSTDGTLFRRSFRSLEGLVLLGYSLVFIAAVLAVDMVTPGEINVPILYLVPVVLVGLAGRRPLMWILALACAALTFLGFYVGNLPTASVNTPDNHLLLNRSLACGALLWIALIIQILFALQRKSAPRTS